MSYQINDGRFEIGFANGYKAIIVYQSADAVDLIVEGQEVYRNVKPEKLMYLLASLSIKDTIMEFFEVSQ